MKVLSVLHIQSFLYSTLSTGSKWGLLGGGLGNGSASDLRTGLQSGLGGGLKSGSWSFYEELDALEMKIIYSNKKHKELFSKNILTTNWMKYMTKNVNWLY
jgi:hypothetical protein